jgi:acetolactate synthase-1/2/3 large subunit
MPGPGLTNILSAVAESFYQSVPLVVITIDNPPETLGTGVFHELNAPAIFSPVVKQVLLPKDPPQVLEVLRKGFAVARAGRPGPVLIDLPVNLLREGLDSIPPKIEIVNPPVKKEEVIKVASLLTSAKNPLIWAGEGILRAAAIPLLSELAEMLHAPVMTNLSGRGAFDETHPLSLRAPIYDLPLDTIEGADIILALGIKLTVMNTRNYELPVPRKLIQVEIEPEEKCGFKDKIEIRACPKEFLQNLLQELKGKVRREAGENPVLRNFRTSLEKYRNYFDPIASRETAPITPPRLLKGLGEFLSEKEFVYVTDSVWGPHCYLAPAISGKALHITLSALGCLGLAFPAAIGAAVASPEKIVVSVSGDGAFLFNCQELSTAAELGLKNLIQIVLVNTGYGSIKLLQNYLCGGRNIAVDWKSIDYAKLAESMGVKGVLVQETQEIEQVFKEFEERGGPVLMAVRTENIPTVPEDIYKTLLRGGK